jgi:hypothetical protein
MSAEAFDVNPEGYTSDEEAMPEIIDDSKQQKKNKKKGPGHAAKEADIAAEKARSKKLTAMTKLIRSHIEAALSAVDAPSNPQLVSLLLNILSSKPTSSEDLQYSFTVMPARRDLEFPEFAMHTSYLVRSRDHVDELSPEFIKRYFAMFTPSLVKSEELSSAALSTVLFYVIVAGHDPTGAPPAFPQSPNPNGERMLLRLAQQPVLDLTALEARLKEYGVLCPVYASDAGFHGFCLAIVRDWGVFAS